MNYLIAKTKGRKSDFFKVISNKDIFSLPEDISSTKKYTADYKLEEDEWFLIENFSTKEYSINLIAKNFISSEYSQLPVKDYGNIEYLCSYQDGTYFFQKVFPNQLIRKKWLSLSNAPKLIEDEPIIVINSTPDAIYVKKEDCLYFKKLSSLTTIFKGIETIYREATDEETEQFLKSEFIVLEKDYTVTKVKTANRKRIAMAMDTLNKFNPTEKKSILSYIEGYCEKLKFDSSKSSFIIESEDDLKQLLYGIEQRYYTTILGSERRLANSIIKL